MPVPQELLYTKTHEWVRRPPAPAASFGEAKRAGAQAGGVRGEVLVGITSHAQEELRDVVFVELPKVGRAVKQGEAAAVIESVKAAFDIYAPVSGTISRVNDAVTKSPQLVNQDCYGAGWLFAITPSAANELAGLLSPETYRTQLQAETHS